MKAEIDALVCSLDTPLLTEVCLKSALYANPDVRLNLLLFVPEACRHWAWPLAESLDATLITSAQPLSHATGLNFLFRHSQAPYVLTLDTDALFRKPGVLADMVALASAEDVFAVGIDAPEGEHPADYLLPFGERYERLHKERVCPWCALWPRTPSLTQMVEAFGFNPMVRGGDNGRHEAYDTAGVLTHALRAQGYRDVYLPSAGRVQHLGMMTHGAGRYASERPRLEAILAAWNSPDERSLY